MSGEGGGGGGGMCVCLLTVEDSYFLVHSLRLLLVVRGKVEGTAHSVSVGCSVKKKTR